MEVAAPAEFQMKRTRGGFTLKTKMKLTMSQHFFLSLILILLTVVSGAAQTRRNQTASDIHKIDFKNFNYGRT